MENEELLEEYAQAKVSLSRQHMEEVKRSFRLLENAYEVQSLYGCKRTIEGIQTSINSALQALNEALAINWLAENPDQVELFIRTRKEQDKKREERHS